jgi:2-polyprenyl-3-methyl-5-hydroxy-6-metoxy-1,4-benzoquinol methylase
MSSDLSNLPTEIVEACVNCRRPDSTRDTTFEAWLCLISPYQVRNCAGCGLRWLSPRPTSVGYETVYSSENYFSEQAGVDVAYENVLDARTAHFKKRLASLRNYFPDKNTLNILDYGAATGEFVVSAKQLGHDCVGIEFSADARRLAAENHGIKLYAPDEHTEMNARFDVIHMNHVFEHMPDPAAHLLFCRNQLTENGLLIIEVPQQFDNHIDRLKRLLGRGGKMPNFGAFSLHHTYFFSTRNLKQLIERSGFVVVHTTTNVAGPRLGGSGTLRTVVMAALLRCSDWIGRGGDNIEIVARKANT